MSVQLPVNFLAVVDSHKGLSSLNGSQHSPRGLSPSHFAGGSSPVSSTSFLSTSPVSSSLFDGSYSNGQGSHFKSYSLHADFTFSTSSEEQIKINIEGVDDFERTANHHPISSSPLSTSALSDGHHHNHHDQYLPDDNLSTNSAHSHGSSTAKSTKSTKSSKSSKSYGEFKHLPPLEEMREQFFKYLQSFEYELEARAKVLFLIKFMDASSLKIKSTITSRQVVMEMIDEFCRDLMLELEIPTSNIEISINTGGEGNPFHFLTSLIMHLKNRTAKLFSHERLESFLKKQHECYSKNIEIPLHTDPNDKLIGIGMLDEIQIIIQMFLHDLEDWFNIFQVDEEKFINKWIKTNLEPKKLPSSALHILLKKRDLFKHAEKDHRFSAEDLSVKFVIDSDWKAINYLTKEFSPDWYPTIKNRGKLMQWSTKADYTVGHLESKTFKMVGKLENSLEECVKALHTDDHLSSVLKNVTFNQSEPINMTSSQQKYSIATLSSDFEISLFPKRALDMVLSSQASFVGGEITECLLLMKSYDSGDSRTRLPMIGARLLQKIDNNSTRYIDFRMINLSGIMATSIGWDMARKKFATMIDTGLKEAISRAQKKNFDIAIEKHKIFKTLYDNCKQHQHVDIKEVLYKV